MSDEKANKVRVPVGGWPPLAAGVAVTAIAVLSSPWMRRALRSGDSDPSAAAPGG